MLDASRCDNVTMAIEARIPTILRNYTGGEKAVSGNGSTLGEVFTDLDSRHEGLRGRIVGEDGSLNRFVNVYLNDTDVRHLQELATPVGERDTLLLLPAMAGGAVDPAACACTCGPRGTCACPGRASAD
jgi:sulfur-carrier protein